MHGGRRFARIGSSVFIWPIVNLTLTVGPVISLVAGILILIVPKALNYIIAFYLIAAGLLGLLGGAHLRFG